MRLLERLVWVQEQLVLGKRDVDICHTMSQIEGISIRQGWRYIAAAYKRFDRSQDKKASAIKGKLIGMAQEAWSEAMKEDKKDYNALAKLLRELARLTGVDPGDLIRGQLEIKNKSFTDLVKEGEIERDRAAKSGDEEGTRISK